MSEGNAGMPEGNLATKTKGRRTILGLAAAGVGVFAFSRGASWVLDLAARDLSFVPVDDPVGFRRLSIIGKTSSGSIDPFAGLEAPGEEPVVNKTISDEDFCEALFGRKSFEAGIVPVAFFSDYNCPNCKLITQDLLDIEAEGSGGLHLRYHEWPIFGASSETFARAAIAAGQQGARRVFNRRLQRTVFAASDAYLRELANTADIDPEQLFADMASDATKRELRTSAALVRRLAFPGTPALVVGRTVVFGTIRTATLKALIEAERSAGPPPGCQ